MIEKSASVHWEGTAKKGNGQISTETSDLKCKPVAAPNTAFRCIHH